MKPKSVDWALLGVIIAGILAILALTIPVLSPFLFGLFVGWWACGLFWTYWIQYHSKEGGE